VCQEKEYRRERTARGRATLERNERFLKPTDILNDKYWKGKQRGCVEGSGAQSLRHMVSSFAEIPTGMCMLASSKWDASLRVFLSVRSG
jgi:hypothetical protein